MFEISSNIAVQVFVGSASAGLLVPGDILLSINNQNTEGMQHWQAQHIFKYCTVLVLDIILSIHTQDQWYQC